MKLKGRGLIAIVFVLLLFFAAPQLRYAQENTASAETQETAASESAEAASPEAALSAPLTPEQQRIEMEIKTSSLPELAALCRSLGLSEGGDKAELVRRLREHFKIPETAAVEGEDKRKIITIESARSTEYFKIEAVDEDYARLSGEVKLSLKDGDSIHRIKARDILFNRTRNILTATGGVEYIKESESTTETFRGENITVNLDNWSSIFLNGVSERTLQSDGTTYRFAGEVISRNDEEVMVLSKAAISNAKNPEALWSLNASRVWLLPGSDFAIFNAVLKVGEIPVMYIPFFYYPADEVIFHPVIGFRSREGNFVQTTTYLLGRPKANSTSQSSLGKILGSSSDMEKKREGLFLRSTGKKLKDPNATSLKAMVDYYANLGAYLGLDLSTPRFGILNAMDLTLGFGFSRTVIPMDSGGNYTPFAPKYDGSSDWNRANLFSKDVPFRYRFKTNSSLGGKYGSLSWGFPFYSDPFIDKDFLTRAEEMDWVNMIQQGAAGMEEDTTTSGTGELGSYQWQLSGQVNPPFSRMSPYISGLSISSITSTMAFKTISKQFPSTTTNSDPQRYSPDRAFFAPDKFTIYSINGSVSGSPLSLGAAAASQSGTAAANQETEDPFKNLGVPRSPWEKAEDPSAKGSIVPDKLVPPVLSQRFDLPRAGTTRFSIDYRLAPTSSSELQFRSSKWKEYDDIDWSEIASILSTVGGDASTTFNLNHSDGLYANNFTFSGNGTWRQYSYLNEEAEAYLDSSGNPDPVKVEQARRQQYSSSFYTTTYAYTATFRPLYRSSIWGQSNLQYQFNGLLAKSNFIGTGDDPEWETIFGAWEKEKLTAHKFTASAAANVMEKIQNFNISAELPPLEAALATEATFRVWISETNARIRVVNPAEEDKRKIEPFYSTETLRFGKAGSLTHYMVLDSELKEFTTITTTLSLWGLTAKYSATRMQGYKYTTGVGWELNKGDPSLKSSEFSLSYAQTFAKREIWKKRLSFSLNMSTSLKFDLQRYTSSSFDFTLGFTLGIVGFVDLSLSATSQNAVVFRYFKDLPGFEEFADIYPEGEQNNLFTDLFNSFRFDDEGRRRSSGFKMKSFNLSATHHLGDWNAVVGVTMSPYLDNNTNPPHYEFSTDVSFLVQWVPISEIKSDIKYNKKDDKWTVK
jgi:hypothetical protein